MPIDLRIDRATADDAPLLAALAERTFREAFGAENRVLDMDLYCAVAFSAAIQAAEIADPKIDTLIARIEGDAVAYAQLRTAPVPACVDDRRAIELARFYVSREQHGRGIAQHLFAQVRAAAVARGADTIWLGVWEHNRRAQAFYRKVGFVDVGVQEFLLGTDRQRDRVMRWTIAS